MPEKEKIFVGRKEELAEFVKVLENPQGQAVVVVGQAGMGKTMLVNKMAQLAGNHPDLKCGAVWYRVTPNDAVSGTMELMMDHAFAAAQVGEGSFDGTMRGLEQWRAFLNVFGIGDLMMSLRREPQRNTRDQFLERLSLISGRIPENGRALFVVDPEKYMQEKSDQDWAIVVRDLPNKIKLVFAQRTEDVLVNSEVFRGLKNVARIPNSELNVLDEKAIDKLLDKRAKELDRSVTTLKEGVSRYKRHPYAVTAALDLIADGVGIEKLPTDPTPEGIVKKQCERAFERGSNAVRLLETYAVLEVAVPDKVVEHVSGVDSSSRKSLLSDKYIAGLLREEGEGKRIYHAILADYILEQMGKEERREYHGRAVEVYRGKLASAKKAQTKPDGLAAMRLAEHVLAGEGEKAFIDAFLHECGKVLLTLGLLDSVMSLSQRALRMAEEGSVEKAAVSGNLGLIYRRRGELDKAEEMHLKSLEIEKKLGRLEGTAEDYGNLGVIYQTRGDLDKAEKMHRKALEIDEKIGYAEGIARNASNLGLIYMDQGELDKAEKMYLKSLEISEKLGYSEGIAANCGNLGLIYCVRGELDKAEKMHKKALEIHERLGHKEGMATAYGNLGVIYKERGDTGRAREYWEKVLGLYKRIGMPHMVKIMEGWLESID